MVRIYLIIILMSICCLKSSGQILEQSFLCQKREKVSNFIRNANYELRVDQKTAQLNTIWCTAWGLAECGYFFDEHDICVGFVLKSRMNAKRVLLNYLSTHFRMEADYWVDDREIVYETATERYNLLTMWEVATKQTEDGKEVFEVSAKPIPKL